MASSAVQTVHAKNDLKLECRLTHWVRSKGKHGICFGSRRCSKPVS